MSDFSQEHDKKIDLKHDQFKEALLKLSLEHKAGLLELHRKEICGGLAERVTYELTIEF